MGGTFVGELGVALGLKNLFLEIINMIQTIRNAPKYFASIGREIRTLDQILEGIRNNSKPHPNPNSVRTLQICLENIMATCTEVKNLVNAVKGSSAAHLRGAWEKNKAVALVEKLERNKSSLIMHRQEMINESAGDKMMDNEPPPPYPRANSNYIVPMPYNTGRSGDFAVAPPPGNYGMGAIVPFNGPPLGVPNPYASPPPSALNPYLSGVSNPYPSVGPNPYLSGVSNPYASPPLSAFNPYSSGGPMPYASPPLVVPNPYGPPLRAPSPYTGPPQAIGMHIPVNGPYGRCPCNSCAGMIFAGLR